MALYDDLSSQLTTSFKAGDALTVATLRLFKNAIDTKVKAGAELSDELVISVAQSEIKRRLEAAELYKKGNAPEKAAAEEAEAELMRPFLPPQADAAEIVQAVDEAITATGATAISDMGKVMAAVRERFGQTADMGEVSRLVRERLS